MRVPYEIEVGLIPVHSKMSLLIEPRSVISLNSSSSSTSLCRGVLVSVSRIALKMEAIIDSNFPPKFVVHAI